MFVTRKVQILHTRISAHTNSASRPQDAEARRPEIRSAAEGRLRPIASLFKYILIFNTRGV